MLGQQELEKNFCMEQGAPQEGGTREEPERILGQALTFWGRASQKVWGSRTCGKKGDKSRIIQHSISDAA